MGIKSMTLKTGATMAPTGGTDIVFADDGQTIQNGVHLVVPATTDYRVRQSSTAKYRAPSLAADGTYNKDKKSMTYVVPFVTAAGKVVFNTIRVEREVHPEFSAANALDLNIIGSQMLTDSDCTAFWASGSLS